MTTGAEWLDQARRLFEAVRGPDTAAGGHAGDCTWCPVCQVAAVVRGERPEVTAALADLLGTAAVALRELASDLAPPAPPAGEPEAEAGEPEAGAGEPRPARRIDIA